MAEDAEQKKIAPQRRKGREDKDNLTAENASQGAKIKMI